VLLLQRSCKFASVSAYTSGLLVLWIALSIGICRFTGLLVECGGVVMFGVPIVSHRIAGDVLKCIVNYCDSTRAKRNHIFCSCMYVWNYPC